MLIVLRGEHLQRACAEEREQRRFLLHLSSGRLQRAGSSLDAELRQRRHRQYLRSRTRLRRTNSTLRLSLLHYIPLTLAFFSPSDNTLCLSFVCNLFKCQYYYESVVFFEVLSLFSSLWNPLTSCMFYVINICTIYHWFSAVYYDGTCTRPFESGFACIVLYWGWSSVRSEQGQTK